MLEQSKNSLPQILKAILDILITEKTFKQLETLTNTTISMRFTEDSSEAKITNLDFTLVPIDENIVTLEISVDHRGVMAMEIEKPFQNLPTPVLHCSDVNSLVF